MTAEPDPKPPATIPQGPKPASPPGSPASPFPPPDPAPGDVLYKDKSGGKKPAEKPKK